MSKYIKQDDIFELVRTGRLVGNRNFESVCKAVGSLPTIEVSEDCISREQVRAKLDYISYAEKDPISIAKRIVDNAPSVIPTTEQSSMVGEWENYKDEHRCSECGEVVIGDWYDDEWYDYCPNCGAKMKGADTNCTE